MDVPREGFKVLTHDYRPPIQRGEPIWDGETLPTTLPSVALDTSSVECGRGWNYTEALADALRIARLWGDGRPSCCLSVEASDDAIRRGDKLRCSQLTIVARVPREDVRSAILALSRDVFRMGDQAERMADSQFAWYEALARPLRNEAVVESSLREALTARGLEWELKRFDSAWDAWAAWAARDARAAWAARDARAAWAARAAGDAWAAWAAWAARAAWDEWAARAAGDAWAAWAAWAARDAGDAGYALTVEYASISGYYNKPADLLSAGIREAYRHGLGIAIPVAKDVLGWAMDDARNRGKA